MKKFYNLGVCLLWIANGVYMACSQSNKFLSGKIYQTIYSYNSISTAPLSEVSSLKIVYFETLVALPL